MILTDSVAISLVGAAATVLVSIINAGFAYMSNQRSKRNENHIVATKSAIETLTAQTNGIQEKLLTVTGEAEHAKGLLKGLAEAEKCQYAGPGDVCKYPGTGKE